MSIVICSAQLASPHSQITCIVSVIAPKARFSPSIRSLTWRKTASLSPIRCSRSSIAPVLLLPPTRIQLGGDLPRAAALLDDEVAVAPLDDLAPFPVGVLGHGQEVARVPAHVLVRLEPDAHELAAGRLRALADEGDRRLEA